MRRAGILLLLIVLCGLLSGCWSRRELNGLAIAVAIGIDRDDEEFIITAQVVEPGEVASQASGSQRLPVTVFQQKAPSLHEALRKMTLTSPRRIYLAHLQMLIIQEELAQESISDVLDFFLRHQEIRTDYFVAVARGHAAGEILQVLTPIENIPANAMHTSLETSERFWAPTHGVYLDELVTSLLSEGTNPVLTGIRIVGNFSTIDSKINVERIDSPTQLRYTGLGIFKKDKLIGWLNEEESKGFNYIQGNVSSTVGHTECPQGGNIMAVTYKTRSQIKSSMQQNKPHFSVHLFAEGNVSEVDCALDLSKKDSITWLESQITQSIEDLMSKVITKAQQEYATDFLGFGAALRRAEPKKWKELRDNWDDIFPTASFTVKVHYKIRRVGSITNLNFKGEGS